MRNVIAYLIVLILTSGCINTINQNDSKVIARVHDKYLYIEDIIEIIPNNSSTRDSISIARSYVNEWIRTNVMIFQAEKNLPEGQLDFSKQLEEYRNSLIIYNYETSLINQNLDTIVSEEDIIDYYDNHLTDFELKENIVKATYVIVENEPEREDRFDQIFDSNDTIIFDSIEYYSQDYSLSYSLDTATWQSFYYIQQIIPIETYNREHFLKNNEFIKIPTEGFIYYVKFYDFKIKDDISPLDFKRQDIYNIIISKRKVRLAKKVRKDIYDKALSNKEFEIYYYE